MTDGVRGGGPLGGRTRCALLLLAVAAAAVVAAAVPRSVTGGEEARESLAVTACLPGGAVRTASAVGELVARALTAGGIAARAVPPPAACRSPARPDGAACLRATVRTLAAGRLVAAVLPVPAAAAPSAWRLRDAGLDELGDLAPPIHRACWLLSAASSTPATRPLRSLLDLADADVAVHYAVSPDRLKAAARDTGVELDLIRINNTHGPELCKTANASCATLLTSGEDEATALLEAVREYGLHARVLPLGLRLPALARNLPLPAVVCDWGLETTEFDTRRARLLGPPPCVRDDCPFENRRLVKLVRATDLARSRGALSALLHLVLDSENIRALTALAQMLEAGTAAQRFLEDHPRRIAPREVRVAVFLPDDTPREAYDGIALTAAAALAEEDLEEIGQPRGALFEVEAYDDRCDAARAYKYLLDALGTSAYSTLSAVAGPACGAAFADVARQSPAHALPVLAYTAQVPPIGAHTLLAAGDARDTPVALGSWLASMRWHRLVAISEPATRAMCDTMRLQVNFVEHLELADGEVVENEAIVRWAQRVAEAKAHIIYVCLEDARTVRAALCAGHGAALRPHLGAVWILPATLPSSWLSPKSSDIHNCSLEELEEMAAGHFTLAPEWLVNWNGAKFNNATEDDWRSRWRTQCRRLAGDAVGATACARPGAHAALLYDALRLWAAAFDRVLAERPAVLDLHDPDIERYVREKEISNIDIVKIVVVETQRYLFE